MSWAAETDVFLAVGELPLCVAYLDGWPARQRIWPWATAVTGLAVSVAGNIGHTHPDHPVIAIDRLTAATSPRRRLRRTGHRTPRPQNDPPARHHPATTVPRRPALTLSTAPAIANQARSAEPGTGG